MGNCLIMPSRVNQNGMSRRRCRPNWLNRRRRRPELKTIPLVREIYYWKCESPVTRGQLLSKRDEYWEQAAAHYGYKEIWDALRAATEAAERLDFEFAQAIVVGANIFTPTGTFFQTFDELGNEYRVPVYCMAIPINMRDESSPCNACSALHDEVVPVDAEDLKVRRLRLRVSAQGYETELQLLKCERIVHGKAKLGKRYPGKQRWFYGGQLLEDRIKIRDLPVPEGHLIQVVFMDCIY